MLPVLSNPLKNSQRTMKLQRMAHTSLRDMARFSR